MSRTTLRGNASLGSWSITSLVTVDVESSFGYRQSGFLETS